MKKTVQQTLAEIQKSIGKIEKTVAELPTRSELDQKLTQLRDDINKDISTTLMPMIENHDQRLDRIDKNLGLPHIPVRLAQ